VKAIAGECELVLVIGAPNSSNSLRLVEVATRSGAKAHLVQRADEIDLSWFDGVHTLGLTAGASAPEVLVNEIVDALGTYFDVQTEQVETAKENIIFKLPRELADAEK
jgi:4-hydroxy-3-methylbut-2-en-1-yl diphosphate reductase